MRFRALDGLRGCFALLVALYHFNYLAHVYTVPLVRGSYLFVDFFFVLSGFVISSAYGEKLGSTISLAQFAIRRFGRLWPLHIAVLVAFILVEALKAMLYQWIPEEVAPFSGAVSPRYIVSNVLLIHSLGIHSLLTWNGPSWSISVEFYTYILFAIASVSCRKAKFPLQYALALAALSSFCILSLCSRNYIDVSYDLGLFRAIYGFAIGCLTYRLYVGTRGPVGRRPQWLGRAELASAVLVITFVSFSREQWPSLLAPLVFCPVVYILAFERGPWARLLLTTPLQAVGRWSYSIYMVHALVATCLGRLLRLGSHFSGYRVAELDLTDPFGKMTHVTLIGGEGMMDGLAIAYLVLVVATAALTYRFVEVPGRAYFNEIARRKPWATSAKAVRVEQKTPV